ncbi:MAG: sensor histidine kinase [Lachnospiraceae bacterium]|nr:sensor histidine kinase [Lachnospiraceae bacterium]
MKKLHKVLPVILALILCLLFGAILTVYTVPMKDVSLNLSLGMEEGFLVSETYDDKGWTVYTQNGDTRTELEPDGLGGYLGIELGQTFYFSRVLEEDLDSPTLQIAPVNRNFSVWLDDVLIYTDCPELDNRIGFLSLPMGEWDRSDLITISLPLNYRGKTLTIAQSFPDYTEGGSVKAYPTSVVLYCGYSYESGLIAESFRTAVLMTASFALGVMLLLSFLLLRDVSMLFLSLSAFLWMTSQLIDTSFCYSYFGSQFVSLAPVIKQLASGVQLIFLGIQAGKYRKILWTVTAAYFLSIAAFITVSLLFPTFSPSNPAFLFAGPVQEWLAFAGFLTVLLLGTVFWRKENWFYHFFCPLVWIAIPCCWVYLILSNPDEVANQIVLFLQDASISYLYRSTLPAVTVTTLFLAAAQSLKKGNEYRIERRLLDERRELTLSSYENLRRQHEEIMMLRHDMNRHFQTLRSISTDGQVNSYLEELIGQNQKIRPVVQSGHQMLDIILNGKLSSAVDAGITVEIIKAEAPESLPLSDADLCSLVINVLDNAITASSAAGIVNPYIRIDIHVKGNFLAFLCENSADSKMIQMAETKETVPKHGLGLKIIQGVAERYGGMVSTEYGEHSYQLRAVLPLN